MNIFASKLIFVVTFCTFLALDIPPGGTGGGSKTYIHSTAN